MARVWTDGSGLALSAANLNAMEADIAAALAGGGGVALTPVQLKRALASDPWTDGAGTTYDAAARTALRPSPIYWLCGTGAEPTWSANTYDANVTYGDIVNIA